MTKEEINELLDRFSSSVEDFKSQVYCFRDSLEAVEEKLADCTRAFNEVLEDKLNAILRFGFVPGVSFSADGWGPFLFCGFTTGMKVRFVNPNGNESNTDISVIEKLISGNRLVILKQENK